MSHIIRFDTFLSLKFGIDPEICRQFVSAMMSCGRCYDVFKEFGASSQCVLQRFLRQEDSFEEIEETDLNPKIVAGTTYSAYVNYKKFHEMDSQKVVPTFQALKINDLKKTMSKEELEEKGKIECPVSVNLIDHDVEIVLKKTGDVIPIPEIKTILVNNYKAKNVELVVRDNRKVQIISEIADSDYMKTTNEDENIIMENKTICPKDLFCWGANLEKLFTSVTRKQFMVDHFTAHFGDSPQVLFLKSDGGVVRDFPVKLCRDFLAVKRLVSSNDIARAYVKQMDAVVYDEDPETNFQNFKTAVLAGQLPDVVLVSENWLGMLKDKIKMIEYHDIVYLGGRDNYWILKKDTSDDAVPRGYIPETLSRYFNCLKKFAIMMGLMWRSGLKGEDYLKQLIRVAKTAPVLQQMFRINHDIWNMSLHDIEISMTPDKVFLSLEQIDLSNLEFEEGEVVIDLTAYDHEPAVEVYAPRVTAKKQVKKEEMKPKKKRKEKKYYSDSEDSDSEQSQEKKQKKRKHRKRTGKDKRSSKRDDSSEREIIEDDIVPTDMFSEVNVQDALKD